MKRIISLFIILAFGASDVFSQEKNDDVHQVNKNALYKGRRAPIQSAKALQFYSYHLSEYTQPVLTSSGKYQAYFKNLGDVREQGKINIDEVGKTITIKWLNGDEWVAKISKKEKKSETDELLGSVVRTEYSAKWTDENFDCLLILTETKSDGCFTVLKSKKVTDDEHGINTWKKTFVFGTRGQCYTN